MEANSSANPGWASNCDFISQRAELLRRFHLFAGIPLGDCAKIGAHAQTRHFQRGATIFREGDDVLQLIILTSGCVKLSQFNPTGHQEVILRLIGPGECLGEECLAKCSTHCLTAQTLELSSGLMWDANEFVAVAERFPALRSNFSHRLEKLVSELQERFCEVSAEKVALRLSSELVRLLAQVGKESGGHVEISLSRKDLAQLIGTTPFTVSRLLCQWELQGIVKPRREAVEILDIPALVKLSRSL